MKDFLGKELELGDLVVTTRPNYREFVKAKIIAFTPKKVRVEYTTYSGRADTYLSEPNFLVLYQKCEWPDKIHESHKAVRSSDASTFDFICDDCGATDDVTGGWGTLRKPCKGAR